MSYSYWLNISNSSTILGFFKEHYCCARDLEGTCIHPGMEGESEHQGGKCNQPREEKNRRLKEMVESFGLQHCIMYRSLHEFIFAVNAKNPEPVDYKTVGELKDRIMTECPLRTISIPISYHAVELTLKEKVKELGQTGVFSVHFTAMAAMLFSVGHFFKQL